MRESVFATYTLELLGPPPKAALAVSRFSISGELLRETEENMSDLLPEGFSVRITEQEKEPNE